MSMARSQDGMRVHIVYPEIPCGFAIYHRVFSVVDKVFNTQLDRLR